MTDVLLQTKLFKPAPRPSLIARPHLIEQLNATLGQGAPGFAARLTLVSAPAGFGKTTLIADWLSQFTKQSQIAHNSQFTIHNCAWLSLDESDNDPVRFLSYLIAALQTAVPGIGQTAVQLLQSPQPPAAETILTLLINDVSQADQPIILVLDDYHVITTPAVHQALTFLLDHLPPLFQLLITSRSDPPLPLSRLRARRQMVEIRANDLRFTLDEVRTYFNQVMGLTLSHEETAALEQRTEGWVAGLQLAALSLKGRVDRAELIAAFTGSHRYIIDYLTEEVLSHQSESVRDFLLATSILERVCGPLADALMQSTSGQVTLEYLEHNNLFLTPLDDERRWYRYHHLFAEVLRLRLRRAQPDLLGELHRRASVWHEQNGLLTEAVSHAFKAGEIERAASLIEQTAPAWLETGTVRTLRGWLDTLPEAIVRARPQLNLTYAYVLAYMGDPAGFKARLDEIEQMLRAPNSLRAVERNDLLGEVAALQARAASDRNEPLDATELRTILATVSAGNSRVQGILALAIGHAERLSGNLPEAARFFTRAAELARERGDRLQTVYVMGSLADLQEIQGLLGQAAQTYQQTLQLATSANGKPLPIAATACIGLGKLFYEWNDLEKAAHYLQQGMELGKQSGVEIVELYSAMPLALVLQGQGDISGADAMIQRATQIAKKWNLRPTMIRVAAYEAQLWLMRGQWQTAASWARANSVDDSDKLRESLEIAYCTLARLLIAQGKPDEALLLLNRLLPAAERNGWLRHLLEILALQALACQAQGDTAGAVITLERALTLAEPEGYVRVFVDEGEPLRALLHDYRSLLLTRPGARPDDRLHRLLAYADKLIAAFPTAGNVPAAQLPPYLEPLTERELEVLRLIAAGASNREIAEALVVAVSTVKKHISNILSKLHTTSRTQAVAEARELGLLL